MLKKDRKWTILLLICFISGYAVQYLYFYGFQESKRVNLPFTYHDVDFLTGNISTSDSVKIVRPLDSDSDPLPAVILVHGDYSSSKFMNLIKLQFLRSNYIVALLDVGYFTLSTFVLINETIDYLLNQDDVNSSQIGIVGHSHGGHYSVITSIFRNESINGVILANFGYLNYWNDDYYSYYRNFIAQNASLPFNYDSYVSLNYSLRLPMNSTTPNNLLMVTDDWDDRLNGETPEFYFGNFTDQAYSTRNELYGNFEDGSARKLFVTRSIFGHASGLYHPESLNEQINWMNRALNVEIDQPSALIPLGDTAFTFGSIVFLFIISLALVSYIVPIIGEQRKIVRWVQGKMGFVLSHIDESTIKTDECSIKTDEHQKLESNLKANGELSFIKTMQYLFIPTLPVCLYVGFYLIPDSVSLLNSIHAFPITIIEFLGININGWLLSASWPYMFMFFLIIGYSILWKKVLQPGLSAEPRFVLELKTKEFLIAGIYAIEIYGMYHLSANMTMDNVLGPVFNDASLYNVALGIPFFYVLNRIWLSILERWEDPENQSYIKNFLLCMIIYAIPMIPLILYSIIVHNTFPYEYILRLSMGISFISFFNHTLRNRKVNLLTLTIVDYLLVVFAFDFILF